MNTLFKKAALVTAIAGFTAGSASAGTYSSRIIGGGDAPADTYPWMVSVQSISDGEHFCGGSLIASSYVLTAAHCVEDIQASDLQVVISEFDLASSSGSEETIQAKNVYIHENYGDDHDIAVIELASASGKTPVQLADQAFNDAIAVGSNLTVMGWGNLESEGERFPNILQEVQVPLADHEQCRANYENVDMDITDNMICAGLPEGGKDSCQGDSGGPLVYQKDSDWFQTGVVSFGEGCAQENYFGVYTKVANYGEWIAQAQAGEIAPFQPEEDDFDEHEDYDEYDEHDEYDDFDEGFEDEYGDDDEYGEEGEYGEWEDGDTEEDWYDEEFDYEEYELAFELPEFVDFIALEEGESVEESITLFNTNDEDLSIQGVTLDNDQVFSIVSNACDAATLKPEEECEVVLSFNAADDEFHEAMLAISTSDAEHSNIEIELFGTLLENLELDEGFDGLDGIDDEEWFFEGDDAWVGDEDSGSFNLEIGSVNVDSEAMLMTNIEGPGVLSFDMNLQGDAEGNSLTFLVDGEAVTSLSSERANKSHTVELSEGEHQVAWIYSKTQESDASAVATIDNIEFESEFDDSSDESTNGDVGSILDDEDVQESAQDLADAIAEAGSTDALLLALVALCGLGYRLRK